MDDDENSASDSHHSLEDVFETLEESLFQDLCNLEQAETEKEGPCLAIQNTEAGPSKETGEELALAYQNLPPDIDKVAWESAQSRSRKQVPFVRRRIVNHKKFTKWQVEVRMPPPLVKVKTREKWDNIRLRHGLPTFTDEEFAEKWKNRNCKKDKEYVEARGLLEVKRNWQTDIEAEVAGTVLSMIYDDYATADWESKHPGQPRKKSYGRRFIRFHGCRWLIEEQLRRGIPIPDLRDETAVRNFVFDCSQLFKDIADRKKADDGYHVPDVLSLPVTEYIENGWRFDRVYREFWPDPKLNYEPSVNKRKSGISNDVDGCGSGSWMVLEVRCESHPQPRFMRWRVAGDMCLCHGVVFRIEDSTPGEGSSSYPMP